MNRDIAALEARIRELESRASKKGALPIWRHCLNCESRFAVMVASRKGTEAVTVCPLCGSPKLIVVGKVSE